MPDKFKNLAFVDIETTGADFTRDRIIEISVLRMENGRLKKKFTTLINPEIPLSPFITQITGIQPKDLEKSPSFFDIHEELLDTLDDCIFVAHNVMFDYSFIKTEFNRLGKKFNSKTLCTVKLSRHLFPNEFRHNLDSIIERFGFECLHRHRAYDDAKVIFDFYKHLKKNISSQTFNQALETISKRSSLPPILGESNLELLPETPGVYIFYSNSELPLYIGKSQNIKSRVLSHFQPGSPSLKKLQPLSMVKDIKYFETSSDLGASILESKLIKDLNPLVNRQLRSVKKYFILTKTNTPDQYLSIKLKETENIPVSELENILGIFNSKKKAQKHLENIAKEYNLCSKLLNLEDASGACFLHQIDVCFGACIKKEHFLKYNLRFLKAFSHRSIRQWPFPSPIVISETHPFTNLSEKFIIHNWCLLGTLKTNETLEDTKFDFENLNFDYDLYKIFKRYIFDSKNQPNIKRINIKDLLVNF